MSETVIRTRLSRSELRKRINRIPSEAKQSTTVLDGAGEAVLRRVDKAFRVKSRGGTDECGERWRQLSPATIAKMLSKKSPTDDGRRPSSALSTTQREHWWNFYRSALAKFHDKAIAARIAWSQIKQRGAIPHFDKYGRTALLILRDTEALLASLRQGARYNIFRRRPGRLDVGTDRPGATAHHRGAADLPQRRLWPHPSKWTSAWWQEVVDEARDAVIQMIVERLR